jgi:hypothetical protein
LKEKEEIIKKLKMKLKEKKKKELNGWKKK